MRNITIFSLQDAMTDYADQEECKVYRMPFSDEDAVVEQSIAIVFGWA